MILQMEKGMKPPRHPVHVKQRHEPAPEYVREKRDLAFDVSAHDRNMMDASRFDHVCAASSVRAQISQWQ